MAEDKGVKSWVQTASAKEVDFVEALKTVYAAGFAEAEKGLTNLHKDNNIHVDIIKAKLLDPYDIKHVSSIGSQEAQKCIRMAHVFSEPLNDGLFGEIVGGDGVGRSSALYDATVLTIANQVGLLRGKSLENLKQSMINDLKNDLPEPTATKIIEDVFSAMKNKAAEIYPQKALGR